MTRRSWEVLFLGLVTFLLYANTLWNGFVWDDNLFIINNTTFQNYKGIFPLFFQGFCEGVEKTCGYYRPLVSLSYLLDYFLWGLNPLGFHLTNVFFHLLVTLGVFWMASNLVDDRVKLGGNSPQYQWIPFLSGLVFAIHPAHVESVAFVAARTDSPAALGMMGALTFFIAFRSSRSWTRGGFLVLSLVLFALALLTKEMAVTLPFLLLAYDFFFNYKRNRNIPQMILVHIPFWIVLGIYLWVRWRVLGNMIDQSLFWEDLSLRLLHVPALLLGYMKLMVFPIGLRLYHPLPSIGDRPIWDGILPLLFLIVLIYFVFRMSRTRPLAGFSFFWFIITFLPVLNLIPLSYPAVTERFAYIPSIGFCLFIGGIISEGMVWLKKSQFQRVQRVMIMALIFLGFVFSGVVVKRNYDWATNLTLWSKEIERSPYSSLSHYNYGVILQEGGLLEDAFNHYWDAIHLNPRDYQSYLNLAKLQERKGDLERAVYLHRESIRIAPRFYKTHYSLGTLLLIKGNLDLAQTELETAIQLNPTFSQAQNNLGFIFYLKGDSEAALNAFKKAIQLDPKNGEAYQNLGIAFKQKGEYQEAEQELLKALSLNPQLVEAHRSLGFLYLEELNRFEKALHHLLKVKQLLPEPDQELDRAIAKLKE